MQKIKCTGNEEIGPNLIHNNEMLAISTVQQPVWFVQTQSERGKRCPGHWVLSFLNLGTFVLWQGVNLSEQFASGVGSVLFGQSDEDLLSIV